MSSDALEDNTHPVAGRLFSPGKKRILALDGGGVRGIISIAFLGRMEELLRQETGREDLVLSDVFDMISGTSVGSMLATMLSMGKEVSEIEAIFREMAPKIFAGRETMFGMKRFDARPLVNGMRKVVKDETLGSEKLLTGLTIVAKRVDTGSVWVLSNNPNMKYFNDGPNWKGNKHYKLESIVRASTAAPFLFTPTKITVHTDRHGEDIDGWFVDGGVSPHNNPALQLLLMAGLPSYELNWKVSPDDLLVISVGTGCHRAPVDRSKRVVRGAIASLLLSLSKDMRSDIEEAAFAANTLRGVIADNAQLVLKMMQSLSNPRFSWQINGEIGSLEGELLAMVLGAAGGADPRGIVKFQRYDLPLEAGGLVKPEFDVGASQNELLSLHAIDDPSKIDQLYGLASVVARKQVSMLDFEGFL